MKQPIMKIPSRLLTSLVLAAGLSVAGLAGAQSADSRTIVPEAAPAFPAFQQWLQSTLPPLPNFQTAPAQPSVQTMPLETRPGAAATSYQPLPVILGTPDLPLLRATASQAGMWSAQFNYQGMHVRYVVLDAEGRVRAVRPMSSPPRVGERFKIRVTPTVDAVAEVDLVVGDVWARQRVGQFYPKAGFSVQIKAGETADLPLGASEYFFFPQGVTTQAAVLSVRHPRALGDDRSDQPTYRQDGRNGSDYLQLVVARRLPVLEQLITVGR
jgi:hypothetical protein